MISEQLAGFLQFCARGSDPLGHSNQETSGLLQVTEEAAHPLGPSGRLTPKLSRASPFSTHGWDWVCVTSWGHGDPTSFSLAGQS